MHTAHVLNSEAPFWSYKTQNDPLYVSWQVNDWTIRSREVRFSCPAEKLDKLLPGFRNESFRAEKTLLVDYATVGPTDS